MLNNSLSWSQAYVSPKVESAPLFHSSQLHCFAAPLWPAPAQPKSPGLIKIMGKPAFSPQCRIQCQYNKTYCLGAALILCDDRKISIISSWCGERHHGIISFHCMHSRVSEFLSQKYTWVNTYAAFYWLLIWLESPVSSLYHFSKATGE